MFGIVFVVLFLFVVLFVFVVFVVLSLSVVVLGISEKLLSAFFSILLPNKTPTSEVCVAKTFVVIAKTNAIIDIIHIINSFVFI